ncbi:MAG: alanine--tRNA ligase [bacterium]
MNWEDIIDHFIDYFTKRGHTNVASSPLIPIGDPTLLFTSAGMVQFKRVFSGLEDREYKRAVSLQKCFRTSDIDRVGETLRHHTFFFMLGNFSFGDYFKREAIDWAWNCLVNHFGVDESKLLISIYKDDDEAYSIWNDEIGLSSEKIYRLGEKDNFWGPAGDTGPCGPSSEIYYDLGEKYGCGKKTCQPGCDCDRFFEVWNLVFPQFNMTSDGKMEPLAKPGIDTGLGLERLAMILQEAFDPYRTDLLLPITNAVEEIAKISYSNGNVRNVRVIVDHIRALVFTISEGILPSNEGRGYVIRRLIRRAMLRAKLSGFERNFLSKLVPSVVNIYKSVYKELRDSMNDVVNVIKREEELFRRTLKSGLEHLDRYIETAKAQDRSYISGEEAFQLYDTYGFPIEMTIDLAKMNGLKVELEGYESQMAKQREKSRVGIGLKHQGTIMDAIMNFKGYECHRTRGKILKIVRENKDLESVSVSENVSIVVSPTPFYPGGGGQISDTGFIIKNGARFIVNDLMILGDGNILHIGNVKEGEFLLDDDVICEIDLERRREIERHHTATHLLHWALREVFGSGVKQAGSSVDESILRFDYTISGQPKREDLIRVEELVNEKIVENSDVRYRFERLEKAQKEGVIALFEEKYGEVVRVLEIGDYSKELCGGTHVKRTGDIGSFFIISDSALSAGIRRIEGVCGISAVSYSRNIQEIIRTVSLLLNIPVDGIVDKVGSLKEEIKNLEKRLSSLTSKLGRDVVGEIERDGEIIKDVLFFGKVVEDFTEENLRQLIDIFKERFKEKPMVVVLLSSNKGKVIILTGCTEPAIRLGLNAGELAREGAKVCDGSGGGRADFAQAGGKNTLKVKEVIDRIRTIILERISL